MTLPPIAQLERHLSHLPPLTPPEDIPIPHPSSQLQPQLQVQTQTQPQTHTRPPLPLPKLSQDDFFMADAAQVKPMPTPALELAVVPLPLPLPLPVSQVQAQLPSNAVSSATQAQHPQSQSQQQQQQATQQPPAYLVDWLDFTRTRSAHFIAEKTCEMICYLWFATPSPERGGDEGSSGSRKSIGTPPPTPPSEFAAAPGAGADCPSSTPPLPLKPARLFSSSSASASTSSAVASSAPSTLQLVATPTFVTFMQKLLETTQVSQSVIVLSLHYIYRLKERNRFTPAQPGSEFRIAVAGLMMGNKFLDE
ncbi:hypothetical protein BDZ97DRAFT_1848234 [Flammula alnicola]|nr:hypothetical protein BDZ97DRAFT_1848234 [Flammula alnicola]